MKRLFVFLLSLSVMLFSCKKDNTISILAAPAPATVNIPKPIAGFQIFNALSDGWILEGSTVEIGNLSTDADSYYWDFGNGTYSTNKIPTDVSFNPGGKTYTITLTVKNKAGDSDTFSQTFNIQCSGKHAPAGG